LPDPLAPAVTVIHPAPLTAVHAHPFGAVTATFPVLAEAGTLPLVGEIPNVQVTPCCVTV
jgi:hypothetical protein